MIISQTELRSLQGQVETLLQNRLKGLVTCVFNSHKILSCTIQNKDTHIVFGFCMSIDELMCYSTGEATSIADFIETNYEKYILSIFFK